MEYTQADRDRMIRIEGKLDGVLERTEDIEHDLYGNGRPGLVSEFVSLATKVDERTDPKKVAGVSGFLSAVITLLGALLAREAGV